MNVKKPYITDWSPRFFHEGILVRVNEKTYTVSRGDVLQVNRKVGLHAGRYVLAYAEYSQQGVLLMHVDGPLKRESRRKMVLEADIRRVVRKRRQG